MKAAPGSLTVVVPASSSCATLAVKGPVPHLCPPNLNAFLKNPVSAVWLCNYPMNPLEKCPSLKEQCIQCEKCSVFFVCLFFFFNKWMKYVKPSAFGKNSHV